MKREMIKKIPYFIWDPVKESEIAFKVGELIINNKIEMNITEINRMFEVYNSSGFKSFGRTDRTGWQLICLLQYLMKFGDNKIKKFIEVWG